MPTFEYIALNTTGKQTRGTLAAESPAAARRMLRNRRLHATQLRPIREVAASGSWSMGRMLRSRRRRIVLEFTRQLATMIQADVQLTEALGVLIGQAGDKKFCQIIQNIRDELLAGESLADGLKEYPDWFDAIYVAMVRIGEVTGYMGRSLKLLAEHMAKRQRFETKIKSALVYPAILVVMAVVVTVILMTFVVPKIAKIIEKTGRTLPAVTRGLMAVSDAFVDYWWLFLLVLAGLTWLVRRTLASPKGRLAFDRAVLKLPLLGEMIRQSVVARFTSTLAALIRSGLPMADSLQVVAEVTGNGVMSNAITAARDRIMAGADIATPLRQSKVVGPAVAHMISVGERTGELESMLLNIAESIEERTDVTIQRISSLIEPLIIVVLAIVIGFIVVATILPMLQAASLTTV